MTKFDYSYEESKRLAALEDARGAFGDPQSIGGYAQAFKRKTAVPEEQETSTVANKARPSIGSLSRRGIRALAKATMEVSP
jgi:hypothetical protein